MSTSNGALSGIKILDLTQFLSGPFCTMTLGDLGAEVIKIERPKPVPGSGPFLNGERIYDLSLNRSKKGITINLKSEKEKKMLLKMAEKADVLIENFRPGTMDKMGLGYEDMKKVNPRLVYVSISGYGHTGPYKEKGALDVVIQGMSGMMSLTGEANGRPTKVGPSVSDIIAGFYAGIATLAALRHRDQTGKGQFVDIAMLDASFSCLENAVANYFATGICPTRVGNRHQVNAPFQPYKTADGEIIITATRNPAFFDMCKALGREDLTTDERFNNPEVRRVNVDALEEEITKTTITMTMAEVEEKLEAVGVPTGRINTVAMIAEDPQIIARNMIVELDHPVAGKYKMPGSPIKMSDTPVNPTIPAPCLGQHNHEVFRELLDMSDEEIDTLLAEQQSRQ